MLLQCYSYLSFKSIDTYRTLEDIYSDVNWTSDSREFVRHYTIRNNNS